MEPDISADPPQRVERPVMCQSWNHITFLHWPFDPETVQRLLPAGLRVAPFDGRAWVGMTPFLLENLRTPVIPATPWLSRFPETNVRTYVHGPDGRRGVWFFALDCARLPAVLAARALYLVPYVWSDMTVEPTGDGVHYTGRRRWPWRGAGYDVTVRVGDAYEAAELGPLDHFLTGLWHLYARAGRVLLTASVEHPRWPLFRAEAIHVEQDLLAEAGLPANEKEPIVHFSTGVDTRISRPRIARSP